MITIEVKQIEDIEYLYTTTFEHYDEEITISHTSLWKEAVQIYKSFCKAIPTRWNRSRACSSEIQHMDMKANLFNQGSVTLYRCVSSIR